MTNKLTKIDSMFKAVLKSIIHPLKSIRGKKLLTFKNLFWSLLDKPTFIENLPYIFLVKYKKKEY